MEITIQPHSLPKAMFGTPKIKKFSLPVVSTKYSWLSLYGVSQAYWPMTLLDRAQCKAAPSLYALLMRDE